MHAIHCMPTKCTMHDTVTREKGWRENCNRILILCMAENCISVTGLNFHMEYTYYLDFNV